MIYVVSDALVETAEFVVRTAASQFFEMEMDIIRIPYVSDRQHIRGIVEGVSRFKSIFAYTLVVDELRHEMISQTKIFGIPAIDVLGPMSEAMATATGEVPMMKVGLLRKLGEEYFRRIKAIEFAIKYDDGKSPQGLLAADIDLLGVFRTLKTPICMYLAYKKIKAANVPLVPEMEPLEVLFSLPPGKVVGLTINPNMLKEIRMEWLKALRTADADYANMKRILTELEYAEKIMKYIGCPVIDVTNRAVEETANKVLEIYYRRARHGR